MKEINMVKLRYSFGNMFNRLGVNSYFVWPIFRLQNSKKWSIHNSKKLDLD